MNTYLITYANAQDRARSSRHTWTYPISRWTARTTMSGRVWARLATRRSGPAAI